MSVDSLAQQVQVRTKSRPSRKYGESSGAKEAQDDSVLALSREPCVGQMLDQVPREAARLDARGKQQQ